MTRKALQLSSAMLLIVLVPNLCRADNIPSWSSGYPKAGCVSGTISYAGTTSLDTGWTPTGSGTVTVWPVGGGTPQTFSIIVGSCGNFSGSVDVSPSTAYWITVTITVKNGCMTQTIITDPESVTTS